MKTFFISDLHLDPKRADIQACFKQFIDTCLILNHASELHNKLDSLYILGDLFEFWIGDDASIPMYQLPIAQLRQLSESGTKIYVMHGNRDFLLGSEFEQASGCQLIADPYRITITSQKTSSQDDPNQHILLSHGDIFCTDDKDYISFRKQVRSTLWQQEFLSKPIAERIDMAREMRTQSQQSGLKKTAEITDVTQEAIERTMLKYQVNTLIHGHTHRADIHHFTLQDQPAKRIVLSDWKPDAKIFEIDKLVKGD